MADGMEVKVRGLDKSMARLRKIAPAVDEEIGKANELTAEDMAKVAAQLAPRKSGDLAESINAKPVAGEVTDHTGRTFNVVSSWGVYALWRWYLTEFGTTKTTAQPFILPAYRLLRKRHKGRMRRALSKAVKRALSS